MSKAIHYVPLNHYVDRVGNAWYAEDVAQCYSSWPHEETISSDYSIASAPVCVAEIGSYGAHKDWQLQKGDWLTVVVGWCTESDTPGWEVAFCNVSCGEDVPPWYIAYKAPSYGAAWDMARSFTNEVGPHELLSKGFKDLSGVLVPQENPNSTI